MCHCNGVLGEPSDLGLCILIMRSCGAPHKIPIGHPLGSNHDDNRRRPPDNNTLDLCDARSIWRGLSRNYGAFRVQENGWTHPPNRKRYNRQKDEDCGGNDQRFSTSHCWTMSGAMNVRNGVVSCQAVFMGQRRKFVVQLRDEPLAAYSGAVRAAELQKLGGKATLTVPKTSDRPRSSFSHWSFSPRFCG